MTLDQRQKILGRITLDVELRLRETVIEQGADFRHIGKPDVALIGARMHRQPLGACFKCDRTKAGNARPGQIAPVAQHGNGIEVYGKLGRHDAIDPEFSTAPVMSRDTARVNTDQTGTAVYEKFYRVHSSYLSQFASDFPSRGQV